MANDSMHYVAMAEIYNGKDPSFQPHAPFTYRPLVPFLASLLPLPEMTAINVINVLALWINSIFFTSLLASLKLNQRQIVLILLTFVVSFPVFYYGAIGYVDPVIIAILGIGCYLIHNQSDILLVLLIFIGTFVKETVVLLIPVFIAHKLVNQQWDLRAACLTFAIIGAYLVSTYLTRSISIDPTMVTWTPSWDRFVLNAARFRTWMSLVLTLGVPGIVAVLAVAIVVFEHRWSILKQMLPWIVGLAASFALFIASALAAYSDGRFIWPSSVFAMVIVAVFVRTYQERYKALRLNHYPIAK